MIKITLRIIRRSIILFSKISLDFDPQYLFVKHFRGSQLVVVNGFKMLLDLRNDVGISRDLFLFKKREHLSTDYVVNNNIFCEGSVVVDIGANIGYYALLESRAVGNSGQVYAIEPVSKNFSNLQTNIALNDVKNIRTFRMAVGSRNCVTEINVGKKGNFSSFLKNSNAVYEGKEEVKMVTLDDFVREQSIAPSLVRMDVEGYETEIIEGMKQVLAFHKPALLIEIHPQLIAADEIDKMFMTLINNKYTEVIVIKERKDVWMNRKGEIKPMLKLLSKYIEGRDYTMGMGSVSKMDIDLLRNKVQEQRVAFHALIT